MKMYVSRATAFLVVLLVFCTLLPTCLARPRTTPIHILNCLFITLPPTGERSIVMSVSVCACVRLSVRDHIFGTTRPIFTKFLCMLPVAAARSSSGGVVIRYVLPVYG